MTVADPACYPVDAHVHLYPAFDPEIMLDAAVRNFKRHFAQGRPAPAGGGSNAPTPSMLMLTENAGFDRFASLPDECSTWAITPAAEPVSAIARPIAPPGANSGANPEDQGTQIAIIAGRQIVTREGLEVHALGTRQPFDDGQPIRDVIREVQAAGALAVLPWGVGKWSGRRGKLVGALIDEHADRPTGQPGLMLADSGVRAGLLARPRLLGLAESRGLCVLAGTDPLPFADQVEKPGRFGFVAEHPMDMERPFAGLVAWLGRQRHSPKIHGQLEAPIPFLRHQIGMQIRKRLTG